MEVSSFNRRSNGGVEDKDAVEGDEVDTVEVAEVEFAGILETEVGISQRWKLVFWAAGWWY